MLMECRRDLVRGPEKRIPFVYPFLMNDEEQVFESDRPIPGSLWKIGAREKRFLLWSHKNAGRPATAPGESLTDRHINAVNVRTFLFIDLDGHKVLI